jgi:hypothetical protein
MEAYAHKIMQFVDCIPSSTKSPPEVNKERPITTIYSSGSIAFIDNMYNI